MDDKKMNKKRLVLSIILTLALIAFIVYMVKHKKPSGPTREEKIEILKKLNDDAAKSPPVSNSQKEAIIKNMNSDSKQMTPEEKAALIKSYGNFKAPSQEDFKNIPQPK